VSPVLNRPTLRRAALLAADKCLTRMEHAWVVVVGRQERRRIGRTVDHQTGRTTIEHLQRTRDGAERWWPGLVEALEAGVDPTALAAAINEVTADGGTKATAELIRRAPQMHREHRAVARGADRRMRAIWGPAFDALYQVWVVAEEIGSDMDRVRQGESDPLSTALLALHARACLILIETHALMVQGFPFGAWARTRSLHETAVIATVLSKFGRDPGLDDLGERFMHHALTDELRDLELAVRTGFEVDAEILEEVRRRRQELIDRYGRGYAKDYGWARPLFPDLDTKGRVTFAELENLADSGLLRLDYRIGGHQIHASSWSAVLNIVPQRGEEWRVTGPINMGFTEPAAVALSAIVASATATVHGLAPLSEPMDQVGLAALRTLSTCAVGMFEEAQELIDRREDRIVRRLESRRSSSPGGRG
jgi:hypothetical protein